MNKKMVFLFAGGFVAGGIVGWLANDFYSQRTIEVIEPETNKKEENNNGNIETDSEDSGVPGCDDPDGDDGIGSSDNESYSDITQQYYSDNEYKKAELKKQMDEDKRKNHQKKSKGKPKIDYDESYEDEELQYYDVADLQSPSEVYDDEPYSISYDKFADDTVHDKIALYYYEEDDILIYEEGEEIIVNDMDLLGPNWRSSIGEFDPGAGYIRNEKTGTDYEIIPKSGSYYVVYDEE